MSISVTRLGHDKPLVVSPRRAPRILRAGELKATCDKRNLHRLIAFALAAMFALAGSAATAESSLKGDNAEELERLLAVPAENAVVDFSFKKPPRIPVDALDRYLMWNEIALDTTAIDHTPVDPVSGEDKRRFGEQLGPTRVQVPEIARLFALVNVAMADAGIAAWESKYFYQYWRPVTAIREQYDAKFWPLGAPGTNTKGPNFTPPFPAYPSGHATFGGALFQILRHFWPDDTPFTFVSDEYNGKNKDVNGNIRPWRPASFKSFRQAELENAQSRLYLGIHWHFDAEEGIKQGNLVANYVFDNALRPVPKKSP